MSKLISHFNKHLKGFSISISTLIVLLISVVVVFILIFAVSYIVKSTSQDMDTTETNVGKNIISSLPLIGGLIFTVRKNKKGSFALSRLFYLLLAILVVTVMILLVLKIKSHSNIGTNVESPSLKITCSEKCALSIDYNTCYRTCLNNKEVTKNGKNENSQKRNHND